MIYQKIFTSENPYKFTVSPLGPFPEHRHADFEIHFCLEGELSIIMDKQCYLVRAGSLAFVPPMCSHAVPEQEGQRRVVTLIAGMTLLKKVFAQMAQCTAVPCVYDLTAPEHAPLHSLFYESATLLNSNDTTDGLLALGNIYKILGYLLRMLNGKGEDTAHRGDYSKVENVEKALELIHYHYKEPITVERAAALTGYSKSNFCTLFKRVVGESFHHALNRQRIECAVGLLEVCDLPITAIAAEVGFTESKTFCRVFREIYGTTPGKYRSQTRK